MIEPDFLPIIGIVLSCATPYLATLRWIAYIKSINSEVHHNSDNNNALVDMLLISSYEGKNDIMSEGEHVTLDFFNTVS